MRHPARILASADCAASPEAWKRRDEDRASDARGAGEGNVEPAGRGHRRTPSTWRIAAAKGAALRLDPALLGGAERRGARLDEQGRADRSAFL
jgi:hypothetical protein